MKYIENFKDFTSERYRDIPDEFRFDKLVFPERCVLLTEYKDFLCEISDRYYRNYEIVGDTYVDFFETLQLKLDMRADSLERILDAYEKDYDTFEIGNKSSTEYDVHHSNELINSESESEFIDVPVDDAKHEKPTTKDRSRASSESASAQTGTVTVTADNTTGQARYDLLNKFIERHKGIQEIFIDTFIDCFTLREVLTW